MIRVIRDGRELVIAEADLAGYLEEGYSAIDAQGNVLSKAKAKSYEQAMIDNKQLLAQLRQAVAEKDAANKTIMKQAEEIKKLKSELEALQKALNDADAVIDSAKEAKTAENNDGGTQEQVKQPAPSTPSTKTKEAAKAKIPANKAKA